MLDSFVKVSAHGLVTNHLIERFTEEVPVKSAYFLSAVFHVDYF